MLVRHASDSIGNGAVSHPNVCSDASAASVIAGSDCAGCGSADRQEVSIEEIKQRIEIAKQEAIAGTSPFLTPRIRIHDAPNADFGGTGYMETTILYSGFAGEVPKIHWRREAPSGRPTEDSTFMEPVDEGLAIPVNGLAPAGGGALSVYIPWQFAPAQEPVSESESGFNHYSNTTLHILAVGEATGKRAVTSITVQ